MEEDKFFFKTEVQKRIEYPVTNKRSYQTVPYTGLLGQKRALEQWLLFSRKRCINVTSCPPEYERTRLSDYLKMFGKYFLIELIGEHFSSLFMAYGKMINLERKLSAESL